MREWLVIEDSRKNGVFMDPALLSPTGYFPRDVAETLLGRDLGGTVWFTDKESFLMRNHAEWRASLDGDGERGA